MRAARERRRSAGRLPALESLEPPQYLVELREHLVLAVLAASIGLALLR